MVPTPRRAAFLLGALGNLAQVLNHDGGAWCYRLDNALGEEVIVVSALPKLSPAQLLEMALGHHRYGHPLRAQQHCLETPPLAHLGAARLSHLQRGPLVLRQPHSH